jgi:hypothetical protein
MNERCSHCGYPDAAGLCTRGDQRLCYECLLASDGLPTTEDHHPIGRKNSEDVVTVPGNLHRWLSAKQREWPESLRANVNRHPLLILAALLRSYADFAEYAARYFRRFSDCLVALSHALVELLGEDWWTTLGLGPLWA